MPKEKRQTPFSAKLKKKPPRKPKNTDRRSREYLTDGEIEKLRKAARNVGRHGMRIEISAKQYAYLMGISVKNVYRDAEKIADTLGSKRFTIQTEDGWINLGWISSMKYKHTEGMINVLVDPNLLPYIIDLKKYTSFRLENVLNLNSSHAIKIYQLLVHCMWQGERTISLKDLRSVLGISNTKSYLAYKGVKQRVLEISKREINEKTDLNISYSEIKKGRKVEAIKFKITKKPKSNTNDALSNQENNSF